MMSQTIQQRRRHPFSLEHLVPFAEGQVAGDQQAAPFVAIREHLEQQLGTGSAERKIAQFVADQQVRLVQSSQVTFEAVLFLRFLQAIDERGGGEEADASPLPASSQAQCGCGVSLPCSRAPDQADVLVTIDPFAARQLQDLLFGQRLGNAEVKRVKVLLDREGRLLDPRSQGVGPSGGQFQFR